MNTSRLSILSAAVIGCLTAGAGAQVAELYNPGFEIPYPGFPTFAEGWRHHQANQSVRRWIGLDPLTQTLDPGSPPAEVRTGSASAMLPGRNGMNGGQYQAVQSEEIVPTDPPVFPPVNNWPQYNFDVVNGEPITVSFWFMIPSDNPMVGSRFGLKVAFLRSAADGFSYYVLFDRLALVDDPTNVDPDTSLAPFPGCTILTMPDGRKGIHTNNQWLKMSRTFDQQVDFIDQAAIPPGPFGNPPPNPAFASVFAARFYDPLITPEDSAGIVWVDDFEFVQGEVCAADFDGNGEVQVPDIFSFLTAWFAGDPAAFEFGGTPGVPAIFAFLTAWFAGCP